MTAERERNRAVRIAYSHARAGDETGARVWLELAERFARVTPRQLEHSRRLLAAAAPALIPGQLEIRDVEQAATEADRDRVRTGTSV